MNTDIVNVDTTEITHITREYKYTKECYLKMKDYIKHLSHQQKYYKPQRKADHNLKVDRVVPQYTAINKVAGNKYTLRLLFIIYDEIRNKMDRVEAEKNRLGLYALKALNNLRSEYLEQTKSI